MGNKVEKYDERCNKKMIEKQEEQGTKWKNMMKDVTQGRLKKRKNRKQSGRI